MLTQAEREGGAGGGGGGGGLLKASHVFALMDQCLEEDAAALGRGRGEGLRPEERAHRLQGKFLTKPLCCRLTT
jgi:hypothetical protein